VNESNKGVVHASLESVLARLERRSTCIPFVGEISRDKNFDGRVLVVTDRDTYYSISDQDIMESEPALGTEQRLWVRKGAQVWQSTRRADDLLIQHPSAFAIEATRPAPEMRLLAGAPEEGNPADQASLNAGTTIEGTAKLFVRQCQGGDAYPNNCAHFLSNAFILAGFDELRPPNDCVQARCDTSAKRPIRARDMWCWFRSKAAKSGGAVTKNSGFWTVFQLDESVYWGGHVAIIDSNNWKYYGTGWYDDWTQYSYQW
jgi:hypothetical protein